MTELLLSTGGGDGDKKSLAKRIDLSTNFSIHSPLSEFAAPLLSHTERLAPFHKDITKSKTVNVVPTDRDRCFLVFSPRSRGFLPSSLPFAVARKDVVAGELPAASATTQVQDGETERRKGRPTAEGAEAHVEGTTQGVRLLLKLIWSR